MIRFLEHGLPIVGMMSVIWSMLFYREKTPISVEVRQNVPVGQQPDSRY